jgi:hypothetical protein
LVSLIYTPVRENNGTPQPSLRVGKKSGASAVRCGIFASRKRLRRRTCMDLYHTTFGAGLE